MSIVCMKILHTNLFFQRNIQQLVELRRTYYIPKKTRHVTATVTSEKKDIGEPSTANDPEKYVSRTPLKFKTGGISTQVIDIFLTKIIS